jgi:hypothetical protein
MNFQVPQFIEIEDKIFGPLTFKQFIYVAGGLGAGFIVWTYLPHIVAIPIIVPLIALAFALAFYKINNRPFIYTLEAALRYFTGRKLYLWQRNERKLEGSVLTAGNNHPNNGVTIPTLSQSRLKDLSWSLDIQEKVR